MPMSSEQQQNRRRHASPHEKVCTELLSLLEASRPGITLDELRTAFPKRWVRYGDLLLLPETTMSQPAPLRALLDDPRVWEVVTRVLGAQRVAIRAGTIASDDFRTPQVRMIRGESSWVKHKENGIIYSWDITQCMFSRGNTSEKLRVASWDCRAEVVVDLFAGIGYFSLPLLLRAGARHLHACEWNPAAVAALRTNLRLNGVIAERATVHEGDNRAVCPRRLAQRVCLGLLPSARASWRTAARALHPGTGGWLHVHENVDSAPAGEEGDAPEQESTPTDSAASSSVSCNVRMRPAWGAFGRRLVSDLSAIFDEETVDEDGSPVRWSVRLHHVQFVKSYAPHVDHLVFDVHCLPQRSVAT